MITLTPLRLPTFYRPAPACRPAATQPAPPPPPPDPLQTNWGYGANENLFNQQIAEAATTWGDPEHPLDARLFKALVATESSFDPTAVSAAGAAGLVQLMPGTATAHGLSLRPIDERKIPSKCLPVGVAVLGEKHAVVIHPDTNTTWGAKVAAAYEAGGKPVGDDLWHLDLAAYNGGGSTVVRAMARAIDDGLDCRKWDNLIGPVDNPRQSPLYAAVKDVYGSARALRKYREMAAYPRKILALRDRTPAR